MPNRAAPPSPARSGPAAFTSPERDLIRRELHPRFGQDPAVADGIMLRTWRGGPNAGQPKLPPAVRTMIERGLAEVHTGGRWPTAHFTAGGLAALRQLAQDRRAIDPARYANVWRELGVDAARHDRTEDDDASGTGTPASTWQRRHMTAILAGDEDVLSSYRMRARTLATPLTLTAMVHEPGSPEAHVWPGGRY